MTIRTDITVNWDVSPRIITVDSPSVVITMQDLLDTMRDMEAEAANIDDLKIIDASGKEPLGPGKQVGLTVTLQNAKLAFEARPGPTWTECNADGGNMVAVDSVGANMSPIHSTAFVQVNYAKSSSPTIVATGSGVTEQDKLDIANAVATRDYEGGLDLEDIMRIILAATAGSSAGAGTSTFSYKSKDGLTTRIQCTFDANGNREITLLDGT